MKRKLALVLMFLMMSTNISFAVNFSNTKTEHDKMDILMVDLEIEVQLDTEENVSCERPVTITAQGNKEVEWHVVIKNPQNNIIRTFQQTGLTFQDIWSPNQYNVNNGVYTVEVKAENNDEQVVIIETFSVYNYPVKNNEINIITQGKRGDIRASIENLGPQLQNPMLIVQVKDLDGYVVFIGSAQMENLQVGQSINLKTGTNFEYGEYIAEAFVWDSWENKIALTQKLTKDFTLNIPAPQTFIETFDNLTISGSSYTNGSFLGQDGTTWTFQKSRGDSPITGKALMLGRNQTPQAYLQSGTISNGISTLNFDYKQAFGTNVNLNVLINDEIVANVTSSGEEGVVKHSGEIIVNVEGDFVIKFISENNTDGQVAIDNITWTTYTSGQPPIEEPPIEEPPIEEPQKTSITGLNIINNGVATLSFAHNIQGISLDDFEIIATLDNMPITLTSLSYNAQNKRISFTPIANASGKTLTITVMASENSNKLEASSATDSKVIDPSIYDDYGNYYETAYGKEGQELKEELNDIIKVQTKLNYTPGVWNALKSSDEDINNSNNVLLLYLGHSVPKSSNGGNPNQWNREHVWPKSLGDFGTSTGPGTDVHSLRPTNVLANSTRNNRELDNVIIGVDGGTYYLDTGNKYDNNWVWEPRDEVKGDVARMIFYMATRYEGENGEPDLEVVENIDNGRTRNPRGYIRPLQGRLSALLEWHEQDPVDEWEKRRNSIIFNNWQHNRNPFIDYPEWVDSIWGQTTPEIVWGEVNNVNEIILIADKDFTTQEGDPAAFTITGTSSNPTVTAVTTEGNFIKLTLNKSITSQDKKINVSYNPTGTNDLEGENGKVEAFTEEVKNYIAGVISLNKQKNSGQYVLNSFSIFQINNKKLKKSNIFKVQIT